MNWPDINITEVFNGIMVVGALALAWISRHLGTKSAISQSEPMQLAGAIIDKVQAETIATTVGANTEALEENTEAVEKNTEAIDQSRRETVHAIESLNREVQNLRQEIIVSRREA